MEFNRFKSIILFRIILLSVLISGLLYSLLIIKTTIAYLVALVLFFGIIYQIRVLFLFVENTNRKLTRFLESIRYSDFTLQFHSGKHLGKSFLELNEAFNNVLKAFHKERLEKQEHLHYLNTIVKHVNVGILAFSQNGVIELINDNAKNIINIPQIKNINSILPENSKLYHTIVNVSPNKSLLLEVDKKTQLVAYTTTIKIKTKTIKIVVLQDIYRELQTKELESWQNLTAVLRHEIMNSITPIASIISTLQVILEEDLIEGEKSYEIAKGDAEDIKKGLSTINNRAKGLISFIDAYRAYTNIPDLQFTKFDLTELFEHIFQLMKMRLKKDAIDFEYAIQSDQKMITADHYLLEMVLINLVKNAIEACASNNNPEIKLIGNIDYQKVVITITDNGVGIEPETLEKIFIPFYSTKQEGSGIGLSLSRQVMQLHNGTLNVQSQVGESTTFTLSMPSI